MILIGGVQVMQGYLKDPEKTQQVICEVDGVRWYITGDKGYWDKDDYLTIVDRYSRFAKLGGEGVSLTAVEQAVKKVMTTLNGSLADIRQSMMDNQYNPLMIPSALMLVDRIPKLGSGKMNLTLAKKEYLAYFVMTSGQSNQQSPLESTITQDIKKHG
jgi:acyl-[acyl-carrier-protein]-phospholipid O-acyltransferase/long-chain-fatty-acid--[acyl-carrier-protein] ligase